MKQQEAQQITEMLSEILPEQEARLLLNSPRYEGMGCHFEVFPVRRASGWKVTVRRIFSFRTQADRDAIMKGIMNEATGMVEDATASGTSIEDDELPF